MFRQEISWEPQSPAPVQEGRQKEPDGDVAAAEVSADATGALGPGWRGGHPAQALVPSCQTATRCGCPRGQCDFGSGG